MTITVLDNAYLKKAEQHESYSDLHKKILYLLLNEDKHVTKHELLTLANYCEEKLDKAIKELEETGTIQTQGWLVKLTHYETLVEKLVEEIAKNANPKNKNNNNSNRR
jgi:low affinity Fe/Cu permease